MSFQNQSKLYFVNIWNNFKIIASSILKNLRTYLYVIIIPIFFLTALFIYQNTNLASEIKISRIVSFLHVPGFMLIFLVNVTIAEWKNSVFLKRIHSAGVSKVNFLISMAIFIFVLGIVSVLISFGYLLILSQIFFKSLHVTAQLRLISFGGWIATWYGVFLTIGISITLGIITSGLLKSVALSQTITTLIILFSLIFSDNFLGPEFVGKDKYLTAISYFLPYKYSVWTSFIGASDGLPSLIFNNDVSAFRIHFSFGLNIWAALFSGTGFLALLGVGAHYSFRWNAK
ncbi:ABC transporter ATP-binding protein [Spiroplasma clarkii]|uniref:Uncharacterized protein n=1 Tax=Spiroplasma clarkii TaxID=2139 RepID=A0A1Y0L0U7_9MOLU|nr:hypothetical protein [Spiroplasma clarkii]ARU91400.1 ABC transporter ATP-binding protein [Spiroplasma clarkii]ATX70814.1 hypothetical protein SCLAR_v1c04950 [Spiroplasma clarkii]